MYLFIWYPVVCFNFIFCLSLIIEQAGEAGLWYAGSNPNGRPTVSTTLPGQALDYVSIRFP